MDTIISILHVGTAVFIVGPMAILPMTGLRALRSGNAGQVRTLAKSTSIFTWLSLLTFIFGFGAMSMADEKYNLSFTTPWILWSTILYVIAFAVTMFLVVPQMNKAAAELDGAAEGTKPSGYGAIAAGSGIASLLLVAVVVLMIWKP
ncbi:conjugal transfer protein TrbL [Microbacterium sp. Root61]|uniref:DUF2269 family protein n=1 Tax=Microbacterium sp. Root61 TaxID=1736570 RepID=UPI0006FEC868|nr:DUF2269 family protein [Microbacterium sp. Root61]KRA22166.1 conjugal transfer protein TrbL [Microbacterium sp. Root61]